MTKEPFREMVANADVKIVAITNHKLKGGTMNEQFNMHRK